MPIVLRLTIHVNNMYRQTNIFTSVFDDRQHEEKRVSMCPINKRVIQKVGQNKFRRKPYEYNQLLFLFQSNKNSLYESRRDLINETNDINKKRMTIKFGTKKCNSPLH
jgi:hypothetical protein